MKKRRIASAALLGALLLAGTAQQAGAENAQAAIESVTLLVESGMTENQDAIGALLAGLIAEQEEGSDALATLSSIQLLLDSGSADKETLLLLLDKLSKEMDSAAEPPQKEDAGSLDSGDGAIGTAEEVGALSELTEGEEETGPGTDAPDILSHAKSALPDYIARETLWKLIREQASLLVPRSWHSNASGSSLVNYSDVSESGHISPAGGTLTTNYYEAPAGADSDQALADYADNLEKMKMVSGFTAEDLTLSGLKAKHMLYTMEAGANDFTCENVCVDYEGTIYSLQMTQGGRSSYDYFSLFDRSVQSLTFGDEAVLLAEGSEEGKDSEEGEEKESGSSPAEEAEETAVAEAEEAAETEAEETTAEGAAETPVSEAEETAAAEEEEAAEEEQTQSAPIPEPQEEEAKESAPLPAEDPVGKKEDLSSLTYSIDGVMLSFPTKASDLPGASAFMDPDDPLPFRLKADSDSGGLWTEISNTEYLFLTDTLYQEMVGVTNMSGHDVTMKEGIVTALVDTPGSGLHLTLPGGVAVGAEEACIEKAYPAFESLDWDGNAGIVKDLEMIYAKNVREDGCRGYVFVRGDAPYYSALSLICENGKIREICFECLGSKKAGPVFGR